MPSQPSFYLLALVAGVMLASGAYALDNGMDMSMDGAMSLASGSMLPYLHFRPGDILWFYGWVPTGKGAMTGACIGLFLCALVDRWILAMRSVMEAHWYKRAQIAQANQANILPSGEKPSSSSFPTRIRDASTLRGSLPFIPSHDISRGIIHAAQALMHFTIMLAVMTYQAAFLISIVAGLGVGEMLFGRYAAHAGHH
ncbi:CTR copper uptake transporter [Dichomitus squalens]|uniref:Copper transport protein n=1 Tax=Dichomitus squalens TaxID=114155 RepID=A0A4Q9NG02_9APHY|nr:CTR copper uptake transporter [Dichomitus squalens]TBU53909.1 CTR copper uptake transporter [Dichomitus squalens]